MTDHHLAPYGLGEEQNARRDVEIPRTPDRGGENVSVAHESAALRDAPGPYRIRVREQLDARWAARFEGLSLICEQGGTTLSGRLLDQAALHGVLRKVRDSGLTLIAVVQVASEELEEVDADPDQQPSDS
jgi:hypothetical protein